MVVFLANLESALLTVGAATLWDSSAAVRIPEAPTLRDMGTSADEPSGSFLPALAKSARLSRYAAMCAAASALGQCFVIVLTAVPQGL